MAMVRDVAGPERARLDSERVLGANWTLVSAYLGYQGLSPLGLHSPACRSIEATPGTEDAAHPCSARREVMRQEKSRPRKTSGKQNNARYSRTARVAGERRASGPYCADGRTT